MVSGMDKIVPRPPSTAGSLFKTTGNTKVSAFLLIYAALMFGNALDAYNLGPIPVQWLAQLGTIAAVLFLGCTHKLYIVPGSQVLLWFLLWALLVTTFNSAINDYKSLMPPLATTPYPVFISLRFLTILSFISTLCLVYWLLVKGYRDSVIKWTVIIGTIVSVVAIYIYIAQIYGLPELPRNRISTDGVTAGEGQPVVFTYAFHRALGTFREPSHLAEWLVVPFFLSLIYRQSVLHNIHTILIGTAILLTGSLTGILGSALGFVGAIFIFNPFKLNNLKTLLRFAVIVLLALVIFNSIVVSYGTGEINLFQVIGDRLAPIFFEGGMKESNRSYIYEYVANTSIPLFGSGLGNANILLSQYLGVEVVASFLSLYFNIVFSSGVLGLALLFLFFFRPVIKILVIKKLRQSKKILLILAAYLAWLIMLAVHAEELPMMFAVACALLAHEIYRHE